MRVPKIGTGTAEDPYRPDISGIDCVGYTVIEEFPTEFEIQISDIRGGAELKRLQILEDLKKIKDALRI